MCRGTFESKAQLPKNTGTPGGVEMLWRRSQNERRSSMADPFLKIQVSPEVKAYIERAAKSEGRSVSNWSARTLEEAALRELQLAASRAREP